MIRPLIVVTVADEGDKLSEHIFYEAGKFLAKHVIGLLPRVDQVISDDYLTLV